MAASINLLFLYLDLYSAILKPTSDSKSNENAQGPFCRRGNEGILVSEEFQKMNSSTTTAHALREHTLK